MDSNKQDPEAHTDDSLATETTTEMDTGPESDSQTPAQPVKVKSTSKAWLVSALALLATAYLYYLHFFAPKPTTEPQPTALPATLQNQLDGMNKLQTKQQQLETEIKQLQRQLEDQQTAIEQAKQQSTEAQPVVSQAFDNSQNESALSALTQRQSELQSEIDQLKNQTTKPPSAVHSNTQNNADQMIRFSAAQDLQNVQWLLTHHQIEAARQRLQTISQLRPLTPSVTNRINQMLDTLNRLSVPNAIEIGAELNALKPLVQELELSTTGSQINSKDQKEPWYKQFVQIKKIDVESNIQSSADLALLKAELQQHLSMAELALALSDQIAWQQQLSAAHQRLAESGIAAPALLSGLADLSQKITVVEIPNQVNLNPLIQELLAAPVGAQP